MAKSQRLIRISKKKKIENKLISKTIDNFEVVTVPR
jgi:hypothetical protein